MSHTVLGVHLLLNYKKRGDVNSHRVDAGYCLDAPALLPAGSHTRDEFGPDKDDWAPMESTIEREPS